MQIFDTKLIQARLMTQVIFLLTKFPEREFTIQEISKEANIPENLLDEVFFKVMDTLHFINARKVHETFLVCYNQELLSIKLSDISLMKESDINE